MRDGFIVDDDEPLDDEDQEEVRLRKERIKLLEQRKAELLRGVELMRPQVSYEPGPEFTAVSLLKEGLAKVPFPLSAVEPPPPEGMQTLKENIIKVANIVQASSKSKKDLSKQIASELPLPKGKVDQFLKDCVLRRKSDFDNKQR